MNDPISFVIPIRNEDKSLLINTIKSIKHIVGQRDFEILVFDGGSSSKKIQELQKLAMHYNFQLYLDFPLIVPNKDIAIMNSVNVCKYENTIIIDVDIQNLKSENLYPIIKDLERGIDLVIPNLNRVGGRWNRILANPFMRLYYPKIYNAIPYPAPGIFGIKNRILKRSIFSDFFYDWGGELQLILLAAQNSHKISSPLIHKIDRKRSTKSIIADSFQVWRSNIYLVKKYGQEMNILNYKEKYPLEHNEFENFCKLINLNHCELLDYNLWDNYFKKDPLIIFHKLKKLYEDTNKYEFMLIAYLIIKPLFELFFNIKIDMKIIEKTTKDITQLDLKKVSILCDYIIASIIPNICLNSKNFVEYLNKYPIIYSEFNDGSIENILKITHNYPLNITKVNLGFINKLDNLYKFNIFQRNYEILKIFSENVIGHINNHTVTFESIKFKSNNTKIHTRDLLLKSSILNTIVGYKKENEYTVTESFNDCDYLIQFVNYMLNNKNFAPLEYDVNINFIKTPPAKIINNHNYDCVVLFSGGVDSTAALLYALDRDLNPLILWVGFGQKNENEEFQVANKIVKKLNKKLNTVQIDLKSYIEDGWKDWDYIVPARNFILTSFAANILAQSNSKKGIILLAAHEDEIKDSNTDKSERFFNSCSKLYSDYYQKEISVITPFKLISKTEILSYWKQNWIKKYGITPHDTLTCYFGDNCGECKACYKRNISFVAAGFLPDPNLKKDIFKDEKRFFRDDFLLRFNEFSKKRQMEYLLALQKSQKSLPLEICNFLNSLMNLQTHNSIQKYKEFLKEVNIK